MFFLAIFWHELSSSCWSCSLSACASSEYEVVKCARTALEIQAKTRYDAWAFIMSTARSHRSYCRLSNIMESVQASNNERTRAVVL